MKGETMKDKAYDKNRREIINLLQEIREKLKNVIEFLQTEKENEEIRTFEGIMREINKPC